MAEVGKGDPRWIVKDRTDGANVNNWHWTEKNISVWAKEKFGEVVEEMREEVEGVTFKVKSYSGDAGLLNRKKKLVFYYQVSFELEWVGEGVKGSIKVEEVDQDEDDFEVLIEGKRPEGDPKKCLVILKEVKTKGKGYVKNLLQRFNEEIKAFMEGGASLSPKAATDDFSDLATEEEDKFVEIDTALLDSPPTPQPHPVIVTIKKPTPSDPMGALIDPDTLEVLEVKDKTPSGLSLMKHCIGMHVESINSTPITSMGQLLDVAKTSTELLITLVDGNYNSGDFEQGVATSETLMAQSGLSQGLKTAFLYNRGLNRYRKMVKSGVKSGIMRNAAISDMKNAFSTGVAPNEVASYGRAWVMTNVARDDTSLIAEAIRVADSHPHLLCSFCTSLPLSAFASSPFALWGSDAVRPFFVSRVTQLLSEEPKGTTSRHIKGSFGGLIRKNYRAHADPTHRTLARKVGFMLKEG